MIGDNIFIRPYLYILPIAFCGFCSCETCAASFARGAPLNLSGIAGSEMMATPQTTMTQLETNHRFQSAFERMLNPCGMFELARIAKICCLGLGLATVCLANFFIICMISCMLNHKITNTDTGCMNMDCYNIGAHIIFSIISIAMLLCTC